MPGFSRPSHVNTKGIYSRQTHGELADITSLHQKCKVEFLDCLCYKHGNAKLFNVQKYYV